MATAPRYAALESALPLLVAGAATLGALVVYGATKPMIVAAAPVAVIATWYAARRPVVALVAIIVLEVTNASGVMAAHIHLPIFQGSLLLGVVTLARALREPDGRRRLNGWTVLCALFLACYLVTQGIAALGSSNFSTSVQTLQRALIDCVFIMIVLMLVQVTAQVWVAAAAIVVPLAVLSALTLVNQVVFGGAFSFGGFANVTTASGEAITTLRYGGPLPDSNFWGRHLVMGLPMAAALLVRSCRGRRRGSAFWVLVAIALLAGTYLTQSRGTFLAAAVGLFVWTIASGSKARRWGLAALPVVVLTILVVPGIGDRLTAAAGDISRAGSASATVDPSVLGRLASQEMASMMFENRPAFGYGPGTFAEHVSEFADLVPTAVTALDSDRQPKQPIEAPHNIYLEMGAESGAIGLLGWMGMVLSFLTVLILRIATAPASRDRVLVAAVFAAIVAWSAASIMLHLSYFRTFGLVLALAAALAPAWPVSADAIGRVGRGVVLWLTALTLGAGTAWWVLFTNSTPAVAATQSVTLVPHGPIDGYYAYALDIRSRTAVLPTFATLLHDPATSASIAADPVRGVLKFSAVASSEAQVRSDLSFSLTRARYLLSTYTGNDQFALVDVDEVRTSPTTERSPGAQIMAAGAGVGTSVAAGLVLTRMRESRRRGSATVPGPAVERVSV